jgi:hypothetical protein
MARTRVMILSAAKLDEIKAAVARAVAKPISFETLKAGAIPAKFDVKLADRKPGFERPESEHIYIDDGYRASFSVEEQPAGLCNHLSVSVDTPGRVPSQSAMSVLAEAYGMGSDAVEKGRVWVEEFDPGHHAVNLVTLREPLKSAEPGLYDVKPEASDGRNQPT